MHANTILLAAMASAAAAQVDVLRIIESVQVMPRAVHQAAAHALNARQEDVSEAECQASLSEIIKDMPTLPSVVADYVQTAPEPTNPCTQVLPLSLSEPLLEIVTSFGHWGAENSEKAMIWAQKCDYEMEQLNSIVNPGDMLLLECTATGFLVFTDASTTTTLNMNSVIGEMGQSIMSSVSEAMEASGAASTTGTDASETGSGAGSSTSTEEPSGSASESASESAAESAAESSGGADGDDGDDGSGASSVVASAAVVALAAVAGFFVAI